MAIGLQSGSFSKRSIPWHDAHMTTLGCNGVEEKHRKIPKDKLTSNVCTFVGGAEIRFLGVSIPNS